ncbi:hypothetical protein ACFYPA_00120 [Streptomyces sp. NPDC005775]|uniref:hypothetical protein n=1 Tax=unclassified Streptomyces TaxID=2593676 RepID=UPI0034017907
MPKPIRTNNRAWVAAWAVLCVAGLAATAQLSASSAPAPQRKKPVSAEYSEYIAGIEIQLAQTEQEGKGDGVLTLSRVQAGTEDDCAEELHSHFGGNR